MENERKIKGIIKQMRGDAREYLGVSEYQTMPLTKLYRKLNKNKDYRRRRFTKAVRKGFSVKD